MWHARALETSRRLGRTRFVTTEAVLLELMNHVSGFGPYWRQQALARFALIRQNEEIETVPLSTDLMQQSVDLYAAR